jgi:hypothetical protein
MTRQSFGREDERRLRKSSEYRGERIGRTRHKVNVIADYAAL